MSGPPRSVVIHGHFYQPPREDPWLDLVPREPSAAPFHDWNHRIEHECYRAVVATRLLDPRGKIRRVVNALSFMSFDFGPTLLSWLEANAPETYAAILEADRLSCRRLNGHGNAVAMPYHHAILPLSSPRDRRTEVLWGLADFRQRFRRDPEGIWLPEAAVDDATLDAVAAEGIRFTILGPGQVEDPPSSGLPGLYRTRSGREIAIFVYDGELSHGVAFGSLLADGGRWAREMAEDDRDRALVGVATDGETYGHHHRFGEMALATALEALEERDDVRLENFASFLDRNPPVEEVGLVEPSSWSCVHGVERWRSACGCALAPHAPTQQEWRAPLREAVTWLADRLHAIYEKEAGEFFSDPWEVRDAYGAFLEAPGSERARFVQDEALRKLTSGESTRIRELLEMERDALRLFTSCAWFFDDLARIEAVQVLRYASRAIELAGDRGQGLETGLRERLAEAPSNDPAVVDGRVLYDTRARPPAPAPDRVAGGCALLRAAGVACRDGVLEVGAYRAELQGDHEVGVVREATGRWHVFRTEVEGRGYRIKAARVTPVENGRELRLTPGSLPEPLAEEVRAAIRRGIVRYRLSDAERDAVATGDSTLGEVTTRALVRAIQSLAEDAREETMERALDLLRLLEILGHGIPWEARRAFSRAAESQDSGDGAVLSPLAEALGFS